jgi:hypothetical protein
MPESPLLRIPRNGTTHFGCASSWLDHNLLRACRDLNDAACALDASSSETLASLSEALLIAGTAVTLQQAEYMSAFPCQSLRSGHSAVRQTPSPSMRGQHDTA